MRKILTLCCIICSFGVCGQNTFKTKISTGAYSSIYKLIQLTDGSYVGIGTTGPNTPGESILLVKLSSSGLLLSSKTIGSASGGYIIKTLDGGFATGCLINGNLAIMKFDTMLTLQWNKEYLTSAGSGSLVGGNLIQAANGDFLITGQVTDINDLTAACVIRTDSKGNVLFASQIFDVNDNDNSATSIVATKDGNFAILAIISTGAGSDPSKDTACIIKIDSSANVIWSRYVNTSGLGNNAYSIISASDGGIITSGVVLKPINYFGTIIPGYEILLTKINASGNFVWSKNLSMQDTSFTLVSAAVEDNDGGYIFSGTRTKPLVPYSSIDSNSVYIVKLDANGTLVFTKEIDLQYLTASAYYDVIHAADGGFASAGVATSSDAIIYKFDKNFQNCGTTTNSNASINDFGSIASKVIPVKDLTVNSVTGIVSVSNAGAAYDDCTKSTIVNNVKSGNWSDAATWSNNKIPDSNTQVTLNFDIIVDINAFCKTLTVNNHMVNVNTGVNLKIGN